METLTVGSYRLKVSDTVVFRPFSCPDYYGFTFQAGTVRYEVLHNKHLGERLLILEGDGHMKDMPFHLGTAGFLPAGIETEKAPSSTFG